MNYEKMFTEQINPNTVAIDKSSTLEMLTMINDEDKLVALAVEAVLPEIAQAVDAIVEKLQQGGRLFYIGSGTSGRLGVLDASECPPTYGTDPDMVVGIIAGGDKALRLAVEGAEDGFEQGWMDVISQGFTANDVLVGISASGQAPYVHGALEGAGQLGAVTIALANTNPAVLSQVADISILPVVGPEVIMGSTRMKAGTAQKMVLNMLTTATMIQLGKTYQNLMVDLTPTNRKLQNRAVRIVMKAAEINQSEAQRVLQAANHDVKVAIVSALTQQSPIQAKQLLSQANGVVRQALALHQRMESGC